MPAAKRSRLHAPCSGSLRSPPALGQMTVPRPGASGFARGAGSVVRVDAQIVQQVLHLVLIHDLICGAAGTMIYNVAIP